MIPNVLLFCVPVHTERVLHAFCPCPGLAIASLEEMIKWKKIAFGMVVGTTAGGAMIIATEEKHGTVPDDAVLVSFDHMVWVPRP